MREVNSDFMGFLLAPPEVIESKPIERKDLPPAVVEAAERALKHQERWEKTLTNILARHWKRRRVALLAKVASVQFRRGTPLWDPPGTTSLVSKFDTLVDVEAWNAELTEELEAALTDLHAEATAALDLVGQKGFSDLSDYLKRWILYALTFNVHLAGSVREVLESDHRRVQDVEDAIRDHADHTAEFYGDQVATSIATGATNEAQLTQAAEVPGVEKIWYSGRDSRVRQSHRAVDGQRVPVGKPFKVHDRKGVPHKMMHPGDITVPPDLWMNCRCVCIFVVEGAIDLLAGSVDDRSDPFKPGFPQEKGYHPVDLGIRGLG